MWEPAGGTLEAPPVNGRAAILLTAGSSSRMGSPKALLPWEGMPLVAYIVHQLVAAGAARIAVVLGAAADDVRAALPRVPEVTMVFNPDHALGRSTSVRAGARVVPADSRAVVIQSVDQPCPGWIVERLFQETEASGADIVVPVHGGRRGHPICVAGRLVPELAEVDEASQGLRAVVRRHASATLEVPVGSDMVLLNLNDPVAYLTAASAVPGQ